MSDPDTADTPCFADLIGNVQRHRHDRADTGAVRPRGPGHLYRRQAAVEETEGVSSGLSDALCSPVSSEESLVFAAPGVQHNTLRKLRKGHIPWQQGIDLHGYRVDDAREALGRFIRDAAREGLRCVLVVHGKALNGDGTAPIIKSHVNDWLRQLSAVLAFTSAQPVDGGTGALYVLLRRDRDTPFTSSPL
ncbi:Smr/MutS family protein [Motiliproteus sp. SC1-56]|uniref:Smr/MutS family protein n=1 Tax=Motiliproteus sp. SC1-56 TaxID=2799565 RepID=UPI001A8D3230|nr:Smr/MutS family protein [Motiliproteus sp. SC1-56]